MNASTCPDCGDNHLCPGRTRPWRPGDTLLHQIEAFIGATFVRTATGIVSSQAAWEAYVAWCDDNEQVPYSVRRFVAAMQAQPGIRRVKRSTMRFAGITWAATHSPGRHARNERAYEPVRP